MNEKNALVINAGVNNAGSAGDGTRIVVDLTSIRSIAFQCRPSAAADRASESN
jgi:hypothetical protein